MKKKAIKRKKKITKKKKRSKKIKNKKSRRKDQKDKRLSHKSSKIFLLKSSSEIFQSPLINNLFTAFSESTASLNSQKLS